MLSLFIRAALFFAILIVGFGFGWEFLMSAVIFFASIGKNYWEFLFLGLLMDLSFSFPPFFFTLLIIVVMTLSLFGHNFFKSEGSFNHFANALLLSVLSFIIISVYFMVSFGGNGIAALKMGVLSFLKIFSLIPVFILFAKIIELKRGREA